MNLGHFMPGNIWVSIAGYALVVLGHLDALKYHIEACKIKEVKSSFGHSRKFINLALGNDLYRLFYFTVIDQNLFLLIVSIFSLYFMLEMFWAMYIYYPYQTYPKRIRTTIKRPNIWLYIVNSLIPNKHRKRL